jgi:hypothetical protein
MSNHRDGTASRINHPTCQNPAETLSKPFFIVFSFSETLLAGTLLSGSFEGRIGGWVLTSFCSRMQMLFEMNLFESSQFPPYVPRLCSPLDRLSDFQAAYPREAAFFASEPGGFLLAINWHNLEAVVVPVTP